MAEPPTKRARRVDSSQMWDLNDRQTQSPEPNSGLGKNPRRDSYSKESGRRDSHREDRRYRSRSRDQRDRRRERSRSRDRRDRDRRDRDRDGRAPRDRERSVSRERYYDRRGKNDRYRDRSRSPARNGTRDSRTPPRGPRPDRRGDRRDGRAQMNGASDTQRSRGPARDEMELDPDDTVADDDIEELMRRSMGFSRFRTTKNTKVPGNDIYGVRKEKKTEYRQYMNRTGGFNRPLSP